jgi:hypothetical protein
MRRAISISIAGLTWLCAAILTLMSVYPSWSSALIFLAYVVFLNVLPGAIFVRLLFPQIQSLGIFVIYAAGVGTVANVLVFIPLWMLGTPGLLKWWSLVGIAGVLLGRRKLQLAKLIENWTVGRSEACWIATALLICGTTLLLVTWYVEGDGSGPLHFSFQGVVVSSLASGWPPTNLMLADVPLSYNYLAHLWLLAISENTSLGVPELVARYGPVFFLSSALAAMAAFGRHVLTLSWWAVALSIVAVWWVFGVPPVTGAIFGTFTSLATVVILSPGFGFVIFFVLLTLVIESLRGDGHHAARDTVAIGLLSFAATGARGVTMPIFLCSLALLGAVKWLQAGSLRLLSLYLLAGSLGFVGGLFFFFRIASDFTGTGFLQFTGQPFTYLSSQQTLLTLPRLLINLGIPQIVAGALAFLVIAAFQGAFLTPGLLYNMRFMMRRGPGDAEWLLLGASLAGIAAVFLTVAPGHDHFTFLQYANISMALLGAQGLQQALTDRSPSSWRKPANLLLVALTALLLIVQFGQVPASALRFAGNYFRTALSVVFHRQVDAELRRPIMSCVADGGMSNLLATAKAAPGDPVVLIVPSDKNPGYCETFWPTALAGVQTIQYYSLNFLPGRARGMLRSRLAEQSKHMMSAYATARAGILNIQDVLAIADTLRPGRPVFVLAANGLQQERDPRLKQAAQSGGFTLLEVCPACR